LIRIEQFLEVTIEELPSNLIRNAEVQKINIEGLYRYLKGNGEVRKLEVKGGEDIEIEVLDKIYNEKYK
jgi:hypothetical protein